ncbi:MAG: PAS domain S-box protein [Candidatus Sulfotelmatobacter sp.]
MTAETQGTKGNTDAPDLRNLIETMPGLVVCALPDGSVEFVNREWQEYTGCSTQHLNRWVWQTTIHPDDSARFIDELTAALAGGKPFRTEARMRRADGQYLCFLIRKVLAVTPTRGRESSLRTLIACEDIHERKQAEAKLQQGQGLLQAFFENSPNLVFVKDRQSRYLYANKQFKKVFHISGEVKGKTDDELFSAEQAAAFQAVDRQVLQTGLLMQIEDVALYEDGPHTRIVQKFPLFNAEGEIYAIGGDVTDITDRKREESALRYSEENYRLVVETAPDAVISIDESGAILFTNPATVRIFGYDPTELIGKPLTVLMPEFLRKLHEKGFSRYLATGQRHINWQGTELTALRKNGQEFPVEISFGELSRDGHKVFTGFIRDISERRQAEEMRAAHARQIAVRADVSLAFGKEESLKTILGECSEAIVRHLDAAFARIWTLSDDGKMLNLQASAGMYTHLDGPHSHIPIGQFKIGMIAQERKPHLTNDVLNDPRITDRAWAEKEGMASFAGYPLSVGDRTIGVLAMFSRTPVTPETTETLASGVDLIAQGIERKYAEDKLRDSERSLRQLTETIPQMLWSAEADGAIDYCNQRALDYTGLSAEQVRGAGWMKSVHQDDMEKMAQAWTAAVSTGEPFQFEFRCRRTADNAYRWCISSALPLRDQDGRVIKWFGTVVDLHDRKEAQQALQMTQAELARVSRLTTMGELAASIAHEVNQPLTAVTNNSNACLRLLAAGNLKPEVLRRALEEIVADGNRASAVVARIRGFIKKEPAERNRLDINDVIQEVLALADRELYENRVRLERQLMEALPPVLADRVQLQQVLLNLIMNGIEAMAAVTNRPRSLCMQSRIDDSGDVLVAVRDSGTGLSSEADRLFTPFFTTKANGMGMGLSITRSLVESHGGRLWAEPNSPHGAVFCFTLPESGGSAL